MDPAGRVLSASPRPQLARAISTEFAPAHWRAPNSCRACGNVRALIACARIHFSAVTRSRIRESIGKCQKRDQGRKLGDSGSTSYCRTWLAPARARASAANLRAARAPALCHHRPGRPLASSRQRPSSTDLSYIYPMGHFWRAEVGQISRALKLWRHLSELRTDALQGSNRAESRGRALVPYAPSRLRCSPDRSSPSWFAR